MSTTTPVPTTPKVRTYAADLTATRAERGIAIPTATSVVTEKPAAVTIPKKKLGTVPTVVPIPTKVPALPPKPISKVVTVSAPAKPTPTAPQAPTATNEKVNPPFHTLSKSNRITPPVTHIDTTEFDAAAKVSKPSVLATPGVEPLTVSRTDTTNTGTIITDTKQNHVSFVSAFITTITSWWHKKQKVAADRKQPKYTVPEAERRKGVIQKATTQTGRTSTADHAAVVSRIKAAKMTPRGAPLPRMVSTRNMVAPVDNRTPIPVVPEAAEVFTEVTDEANLTQAERIQNEIDALDTTLPAPTPVVPRPVITPIIPVVPETPRVEIPPVEEVIQPEITAAMQPQPEADIVAPEPVVTIEPFVRERIVPNVQVANLGTATDESPRIAEEDTLEINDSTSASETKTDVTATKPNWSFALKQPSTSSLFARAALLLEKDWWRETFRATNNLVLAAGLGCGIVVVGWYGIQAILAHRNSTTFVAPLPTTIFTSSVLVTPGKTLHTQQELADALKTATSGGEPLVEISLTGTQNTPILLPQAAFAILQAHVAPDFSASITHVIAGDYRSEPWLVLTTTDTATAQGGMLVWEKTLSSDLSPWFGPSVQRSTKVGITQFKDGTIAGHDVRTLTDDKGTERIIYGFITPNTLLITTNTTAFLNLAQKVIK